MAVFGDGDAAVADAARLGGRAVGLAAGAQQGQVPEATLARLGSVYVPTILALWLSMVAVISLYSLTREQHEQNLKDLKDRNESEANSLQS